ncbi:MaoC/PaaZ C-terminal domain-containing protein [Xanthobacter sp. KR7-65]|uniref:MaoC/PaaZ C-terminal domain-containing protein n=1 Tax=Xanthobacter sp. KR7-65 TaxID=3156612 RepID=UPI0032B41813
MRYLEDFQPGQVFRFRSRPMSAEAIKAFAHEWDPQRLHIDEDYAAGIHGSLIASGFQTIVEVFRPIMIELMVGVANIGGMGLDNLRWLKPIRPDEALDIEITVNAAAPSRSKPDRGVLKYTLIAKNPKGEEVFSTDVLVMMQTRAGGID